MRLYNTLTRKVEEFTPQTPGEVTLYTCGPTVYNYYHIGNLRNAVFNDTLRRTLAALGLDIKHVMNITDVGHLVADEDDTTLSEDKFEKGARREGKTPEEVAQFYTEAFKRDMAAMNVLPPSVDPGRAHNRTHHDTYARATDFIADQIAMVKALLEKGYAYQTKQAVYFDVAKLPGYGELSGQKLADKEVAARTDVVTDPDKRSPHDFTVWFFTVGHFASHSMRWPSTDIGPGLPDGFPGWHLECSAIIHATLGDPIDIHTGGVDHIGTHHPNEMAQTEAAFGHPLAHFWVHNEFILVDGAKMAKSKGNSYTLADVTARGFHPLALRLLYLQSHYRSELNFSWAALEAAQNALLTLYEWADLVHQATGENYSATNDAEAVTRSIKLQMEEDLSTPNIFVSLFALVRGAHLKNAPRATQFRELLQTADNYLGIGLANRPDITPEQKDLIAQRETARQTKDWATADRLRQELHDQHLEIDDTPHGPRWRRTSI